MDTKQKIKKRSRHKRNTQKSLNNIIDDTIFPVLLAALSNSENEPKKFQKPLIMKYLNKLHLSLLSSSQQTLPNAFLSLLPILLNSRCAEIACLSAELVGAVSLLSLETNEQIALDSEIVKAIVSALGSLKMSVSIAACNALLDLCTTSIGRQRLLQASALERLMFVFLQVPMSSTSVSLCSDSRSVASIRLVFKEDGHAASLLHSAITLINTCTIEQLEKIPMKLSETFLVFLKKLWKKVHNQMLIGNILEISQERQLQLSNIRINNLAESIFRLSTNASQIVNPLPFVLIRRRIFGWSDSSCETFMLHHWEASPSLVRRLSGCLIDEDIFGSFIQPLNCKDSFPSFLSSILQSSVSCLPIASDELDILSFLEEVKNELGCPIIYQQDIRVLRTEQQSKREVHFFHESLDLCCSKRPNFFSIADIMKCEEACREGYTVALRGMEFRFSGIAAVADTLASFFGQPSVGANMYLTPPNSQGLACHCDDHCVFVWQLFGTKQWTIYSQPKLQLPRLYDPLNGQLGCEVESPMAVCRKFLLREGDILYIPRGFPHEAYTNDGGSCGSGFSLHLTFGIEVEPPFEWGGFAHVALHCWNKTKKQFHPALVEPLSGILNVMSVNLLHAMIELIGASDPAFRKACLVAALSLPLDIHDWLYLNQKTIFNNLIETLGMGSGFLEVLRHVEVAIENNEDLFQRMRWLQHLDQEGETIKGHKSSIPFMGVQNLLPVYAQHKDMAEAAFMQVKSTFCDEVLFEDVIDSYKVLVEKYKKARKQYMNGMLSLHYS